MLSLDRRRKESTHRRGDPIGIPARNLLKAFEEMGRDPDADLRSRRSAVDHDDTAVEKWWGK